MRSATGGSLPCLTSSASCGASLNVLGAFAASVTTSGPSSFPIKLLPAFCAMAAAETTQVSAPTVRAMVSFDRKIPVFIGVPFSRVCISSTKTRALPTSPPRPRRLS